MIEPFDPTWNKEQAEAWLNRLVTSKIEKFVLHNTHNSLETPLESFARNVLYRGPAMPDKGLRNGSCNRSACQLPLAGQPQWTIPSYGEEGTDGKFYYCRVCADLFKKVDDECRRPFRCEYEGIPDGD